MSSATEVPIALVGIRSELGYLREHMDVAGETLHPWGRLTLGLWQPGGAPVALLDACLLVL